jgi:hypothetical protein
MGKAGEGCAEETPVNRVMPLQRRVSASARPGPRRPSAAVQPAGAGARGSARRRPARSCRARTPRCDGGTAPTTRGAARHTPHEAGAGVRGTSDAPRERWTGEPDSAGADPARRRVSAGRGGVGGCRGSECRAHSWAPFVFPLARAPCVCARATPRRTYPASSPVMVAFVQTAGAAAPHPAAALESARRASKRPSGAILRDGVEKAVGASSTRRRPAGVIVVGIFPREGCVKGGGWRATRALGEKCGKERNRPDRFCIFPPSCPAKQPSRSSVFCHSPSVQAFLGLVLEPFRPRTLNTCVRTKPASCRFFSDRSPIF